MVMMSRDEMVSDAFRQAVTCHETGRLEEAEALYLAILDVESSYAEANYKLGLLLGDTGRDEQALHYFSAACEAQPQTGRYWVGVVECLMRLGRIEEAEAVLEAAMHSGLDDPKTQMLLTQARAARISLLAQGAIDHPVVDPSRDLRRAEELELEELRLLAQPLAAQKISKQASKRQKDLLPELYKQLQKGDFHELIAVAKRSLLRLPGAGKIWNLLGVAYLQAGKNDLALIALLRASELVTKDAEVWDHLGVAQRQAGQFDQAHQSFSRSLELDSVRPDTWMNLANLQSAQMSYAGAVASFQRALKLRPKSAPTYVNLAIAQYKLGLFEQSAKSCRRAIEIEPHLFEAHLGLGNAFMELGQFAAALSCFENALQLNPNRSQVHSALALIFGQLGQYEDSISASRRSLRLSPNQVATYSYLLFSLSHVESDATTPESVFVEHQAFGNQFEAPFRKHWPTHQNDRNPERKLRIGFVSGDFYNHAVATFIEPVWAELDRNQVEIWAYYNFHQEDFLTQRLRSLAQHWRNVTDLGDQALADCILADKIDILIDLSGHTNHHRLLVFARKPAPVQVSWIGYPNTTGLTAMDYYLTDRFLAPAGLLDARMTEKIARLPFGITFQPYEGAPEVSPLPAVRTGIFTFGSFNRASKISDQSISLWSQVLRLVPNSRMLLAGVSDEKSLDDVSYTLKARFALQGITANRLSFYPRTGMCAYLTQHQQVDLILDTFPYGGGTTTYHAMWMGVPVLTLTGRTLSSRCGAGLNGPVGLNGFICDSEQAFVAQAMKCSQNLPALADLRAGLRERVLTSPFGRPDMVARAVEHALRHMWRRWCDGDAAESFDAMPE